MVSKQVINSFNENFWEKIYICFTCMKSSISTTLPPLLDEKNYSYQKVRVKTYIKAIDENAWHAIPTGLSPPTITTGKVTIVKSEATWTKAEDALANRNFKAFNVIFAVVDVN